MLAGQAKKKKERKGYFIFIVFLFIKYIAS